MQGELNLLADPDSNWGYLQTAYGLIRSLHGPTQLAWLVQGLVTLGSAVTVWIVWRSRVRYELKAAILSAAALLATPYAFAYDMAAIVIPAAFLATDQLSRGLLHGEKTMWIVLFGAPLAVLVTLGDNAGGTHVRGYAGLPVRRAYAFFRDPASSAAQPESKLMAASAYSQPSSDNRPPLALRSRRL